MPFLDEYDALADAPGEQAALVNLWLGTRSRELFFELRENRPILASPGATIVTRADDVREVLLHDAAFEVSAYVPRIQRLLGGPFIIGMSDCPPARIFTSLPRSASTCNASSVLPGAR